MCGEQHLVVFLANLTMGSSPRVRGTVSEPTRENVYFGIIPACAGNSDRHEIWKTHCRDHPRVCGEQGVYRSSASRVMGSSPRVRGTAICKQQRHLNGGIIPACAGNSLSDVPTFGVKRDHPRVCGEQRKELFRKHSVKGSSPRVRGTGNEVPRGQSGGRIIPACAGNSRTWCFRSLLKRDHPRVCGEQLSSLPCSRYRMGSSPRVRGTVRYDSCVGM